MNTQKVITCKEIEDLQKKLVSFTGKSVLIVVQMWVHSHHGEPIQEKKWIVSIVGDRKDVDRYCFLSFDELSTWARNYVEPEKNNEAIVE